MKYRAKVTNCISHVMNISRYSNKHLESDGVEIYIEVDSENEVDLIRKLDNRFYEAMHIYQQLLNLTSNK